jgi:hypothetical protein
MQMKVARDLNVVEWIQAAFLNLVSEETLALDFSNDKIAQIGPDVYAEVLRTRFYLTFDRQDAARTAPPFLSTHTVTASTGKCSMMAWLLIWSEVVASDLLHREVAMPVHDAGMCLRAHAGRMQAMCRPCLKLNINGMEERLSEARDKQNQVIQAGLNRVLALHASIIDPQMETLQA